MFDYQPGAIQPPKRISRVNWTQATTITVAAFVGCLLAMAAAVLLYKYMLGKAIQAKQAELNALSNRIDDASYTLVRSKPIPAKPAPVVESSTEPNTDTDVVKTDDESGETEKPYVPRVMPGEPIKTTLTV